MKHKQLILKIILNTLFILCVCFFVLGWFQDAFIISVEKTVEIGNEIVIEKPKIRAVANRNTLLLKKNGELLR